MGHSNVARLLLYKSDEYHGKRSTGIRSGALVLHLDKHLSKWI